MCGISVVLADGISPRVPELLGRMHACIPHRGPDGEATLLWSAGDDVHLSTTSPEQGRSASFGIAFRRLAILDPDPRASQPMGSDDGKTWIAFNGEIYNYQLVRKELEKLGHTFRSTGDTAVILAAWEQWGLDCFDRLDGMWAIVIADLRNRRLVVSRDRMGIKPLYWRFDGRNLLLASEIRQILAASERSPVVNAAVLSLYLTGRRVPCLDDTYFEGVRLVPSSSIAVIPLDHPGVPRFESFWSLSTEEAPEDPDYDSTVDRLELALTEAVASHSTSDVPLGSLLSGGLDSTLLAVIGHRMSGAKKFPTFSFGFGQAAPDFCELKYVDEVVRREALENHQTSFDPEWLKANAATAIETLEEPPLASAAVAQFRIFEAVRARGVTVVLDGEVSDEVFGGYPHHQRLGLIDATLEHGLKGFMGELSATSYRLGRGRMDLLRGYFIDPLIRRLDRRREDGWLRPGWNERTRPGHGEMVADRLDDPSRLNQQLYRELRWGNGKIVLLYTDKNAMAHSVEARVPYLDRSIVELAFSLPPGFKAGAGQRKRVLRDVARRYLPASITERRDRMGFAAPEERFLRESLLPTVRRDVENELLSSDVFIPDSVSGFLDRFERGDSRDFRAVWRLWATALWRRAFDAQFPSMPNGPT